MSAEVYIEPHLSSTTQPNVRESLYRTSPVLNHSAKCPRKFISNLTCLQPHSKCHLKFTSTLTCLQCSLKLLSALTRLQPQPNVNWNLFQPSPVFSHTAKCHLKRIYQLSPAFNHTAKCHYKFYVRLRPSTTSQSDDKRNSCHHSQADMDTSRSRCQYHSPMPSEVSISPEQPSTQQPNAERSFYQPRTAFSPTAQCRAKFPSAPNSLQPNSPMPSEVSISPEQPSTQQPNAERSFHQPRTAFNPTAQCRAKFLSAPNSLQPNSPMPSEVSISPEQPSTQQPNAERSFHQPRTAFNPTAQCRAKFPSAPNSLQPNSPMPSEVSISPEQPSTQQPNAERSFHQPRTAFNSTAQCRAKFPSAPNSLQPNSPMPSEVSISPEQPSTQQPNAERSFYQPRTAFNSTAQCRAKFISAPNSLQPHSQRPSEVCQSRTAFRPFQPQSLP